MGIAALPHWVVESFERRAWWSPKRLGEGLWSGYTRPFAMANSVEPVTEAFIRSARNHACDHLPFVRSAERPSGDRTRSEAAITNAPLIKLGQCGCSCQMARLTSSPAGTWTFDNPQRAGIHLGGAVVPHETQPEATTPSHTSTLHCSVVVAASGRRQHKPRRHRHDKGPDIERWQRRCAAASDAPPSDADTPPYRWRSRGLAGCTSNSPVQKRSLTLS